MFRHLVIGLLSCLYPICAAGASSGLPLLQYLDLGTGGTANQVTTDSSGNLIVVGSRPKLTAAGLPTSDLDAFVLKVDSSGNTVWRYTFGGTGNDAAVAVAVDSQGNIFVAGSTNSSDFPFANARFKSGTGFIAKLNAAGNQLLFTDLLSATINAVALDPQGNVYATGQTTDPAYPLSPGAFQTSLPSNNSFIKIVPPNAAFVTKLSSDGSRLLYSTFLGGPLLCEGGSYCLNYTVSNIGYAITVDNSGYATVAGLTSSPGFPVTQGVLQPQCNCGGQSASLSPNFTGFITRLNQNATALVWSTYFGANAQI